MLADFYDDPDRMIRVQPAVPHPGHVIASWNKTLYNDRYLCLVASNKQQIQ